MSIQEVETEVTEGQYMRAFMAYLTFNLIAGVAAISALLASSPTRSLVLLVFSVAFICIGTGISNDGWCHRIFWSDVGWTLEDVDTDEFKDNDAVTVTKYD